MTKARVLSGGRREMPGERSGVPGYNAEVEAALSACEAELTELAVEPLPEGCAAVMDRLLAVESRRMTAYQRVRLLGCKAETTGLLGDWARGLALGQEAVEQANGLVAEAWRAGEIARVQGEMYRRVAEIQRRRADFVGAAASYAESIGRLWRAAEASGWVATESLRASLAHYVGLLLLLGKDEQADIYLNMAVRARRNARLEQPKPTEDAAILWMQALVGHRAGQLAEALSAAMQAADDYMAAGPANSAARILSVTLEILLDLVESYPEESSARGDYLGMAYTYHRLLMEYATKGEDAAGLAMGKLVGARLNRLGRPHYHLAVTEIRKVLEERSRGFAWDWATVALARMALGRELLARAARLEARGGARNQALASAVRGEAREALEAAVAEAGEHGSPGTTWWALRVLKTLP